MITIEATASDLESAGTQLRVEAGPRDSGTWTQLCSWQSSSGVCSWDTSGVRNGEYDVRTTAVDAYGNVVEDLQPTTVAN